MKWVHLVLLLALALPACRAGEQGTRHDPSDAGVVEPEGASPAARRPAQEGFVGDPATSLFHRLDCEAVEEIPPDVRHYFAYPEDALNARYHPCDRCEPLSRPR